MGSLYKDIKWGSLFGAIGVLLFNQEVAIFFVILAIFFSIEQYREDCKIKGR